MSSVPSLLVYARQAGSAHAFLPLVKYAKAHGVTVRFAASSHALKALDALGEERIGVRDAAEASFLLEADTPPHVVLSGTSECAADDAVLWSASRSRDIPCIAFVDSWGGYRERFTVGEKAFDALPDLIAVVDQRMCEGVVTAGAPQDRLRVVGHPAFDELLHWTGNARSLRQLLVRHPHDRLIVFASEPLSRARIDGRTSTEIRGYDERDALAWLASTSRRIAQQHPIHIHIAVKPHPREEPGPLKRFMEDLDSDRYASLRLADLHRYDLMKAADVVVGMTSMFLVESAGMARPTLSLQPNRKVASEVVDACEGIRVLTQRAELPAYLEGVLRLKPLPEPIPAVQTPILRGSTERFWELLLQSGLDA